MEHLVTGCGDCCLCQEGATEYFCLHPNGEGKIDYDSSGYDLSYIEFPITPNWCPLNEEPITIKKE